MKVNPMFTNDDHITKNENNLYELIGDTVDDKTLKSLKDVLTIEENKIDRIEEKWQAKLIQIVVPFFIAGLGMVGAGILFGEVEQWEVFQKVREIIVLVPALLDLKGNLDMSLASRLSTQVNLGEIHNKETIIKALLGNVTLKLLQSIVVGYLASIIACLTEYLLHHTFTPSHLLILIATSVTSAAITSIFLGLIVMSVILVSKKFNINPDNIGTPIAGSIGDVGTLITLAGVGTFFYSYREEYWIHIIFIVFFIILMPFLIFFAKKNSFVNSTLKHGWFPIILSMIISSISGILLEVALSNYNGIESYQPVINGVGGNLVSIYSSRLSTEICRDPDSRGSWAKWAPRRFLTYSYHTFFGKKNPESKTARLLIFLVLPGHIIFFIIVYYLSDSNSQPQLTVWLFVFYLLAALIQVILLFITCYYMVHIVWRFKMNPDDYCISLLTSFGDIFGVSLLYLAFYLVYLTGADNITVTKPSFTIHPTLSTIIL